MALRTMCPVQPARIFADADEATTWAAAWKTDPAAGGDEANGDEAAQGGAFVLQFRPLYTLGKLLGRTPKQTSGVVLRARYRPLYTLNYLLGGKEAADRASTRDGGALQGFSLEVQRPCELCPPPGSEF